jgi:uncharacterized protein (DUF2147 family)
VHATSRKDQNRLIGMTIVTWRQEGSKTSRTLKAATILDPNNGKVYKVRMTPKDGGKTSGGAGLTSACRSLGRTQTWQRVE